MKYLALIVLAGCGRIGFDGAATPDADSDAAFDAAPSDGPDLDAIFAGCTRDRFDSLVDSWDVYGNEPVTANGTLSVALAGPIDEPNGIRRVAPHSYAGWSTYVRVVQPCAQSATFTGMGWHPNDGSSGIHLSITQSQLRLDYGTTGIATAPYDAAEVRWLRLREAGGLVYGATSPDAVTWNEFGSTALDTTDLFTDVGVDAPLLTVNADVALFDDYIECPP